MVSIGHPHATVSQFIHEGEWHIPPTSITSAIQKWRAIEKLQLPAINQEDTIIWKLQPLGVFSINSAWDALRSQKAVVEWASVAWHKYAVPKFSCYSLLAVSRRLLTKESLTYMGFQVDSRCVLCGNLPESIEHLFFQCPFSAYVWKRCRLKLLLSPRRRCTIQTEIADILNKFKGQSQADVLARLVFNATVWHV